MTNPDPFTSTDHDVSGLDGFMLNTDRLMVSELWALATGDEFKAAIGLWCRAWKQVPAGSLPNDEKVLAAFSGTGKAWPKVRDMALRGFVLCSDGRLYHKTLCDDVKRAAEAKAKRRERTRKATEARNDQRNGERNVDQNANVTESHRRDETGKEEDGLGDARAKAPQPVSHETTAQPTDNLGVLEKNLRTAAGWEHEPHPNLFVVGEIQALIDAGALLEVDVLPVVRAHAPKARSRTSWKYFIPMIIQARDDRIAAANVVSLKRPQGQTNAKPTATDLINTFLSG